MIYNTEYEIALTCIQEKLKKKPHDGHLNYLFAFCHHKLNIDLQKALHHYNLALEYGFERFWVLYLRGLLYYQEGNSIAARPDLEEAVSLHPDHHGARQTLDKLRLGLCEIDYLVNKGKFGDALPKLKQLLYNNPSSGFIHYLIATCIYNMRNNYSEALEHYGLALQYGYEEFWVRYNRGLLFYELTNINAARADLERAVSIKPTNREARKLLQDIQTSQSTSRGIILPSPVLVSCIPKSGTMLLKNILLSILGDLIVPPADSLASDEYIKALPMLTNHIFYGHIWYSDELAQKVSSIPKIILLRDPRSTVVSLAHFLDGVTNKHWTKEQYDAYWSKKNWEEKLSAAIFGMSSVSDYPPAIYYTFLNYALKWAGPNTLFVRYEDLIGSRFGGDDTKVIRTVKLILDFIGVKDIDEDTLAKKVTVGADPSRSATFRSGKIGSWRNEFTGSHVKQMKIAANGLVSSLGYERDENWNIERKIENINRFLPQIDVGDITRLISHRRKLDWDEYVRMRKELVEDGISHHAIDEWAFNIFNEAQEIEYALNILEQHLLVSVPHNPRWNYYYAFYLHILKRDLQRALHCYNIALENGFDEFWVRYNRGLLHKELGELNHAYTDLERAISLNPQFKEAHKILKELKAETTFRESERLSSIDLDKVQKLVDNSEFQEASERLRELLAKFPTNPQLNYLYAYSLHQLKDLDNAISYYDKALTFGFHEFWVRYSRGCLYYTVGNHIAARIDLERAASIRPLHEGPRMILKQLGYTILQT